MFAPFITQDLTAAPSSVSQGMKKMHKVFVTYSFKVTKMVEDSAIVINY